MLRQLRRVSLLMCAVASFAWAGNTVTTQAGEVLTSPRSTAAGNLLFAYVTTQAGFDTEITISNTSQDTLGSIPQSGTCGLTFRGSGTVPAVQSTAAIPAGKQVVFLMSQGGAGIGAAPNFQGYIVGQCTFPLARGVAKITDLGARNLGFSQDAQVIALPRVTTSTTNLLFPYVTNQVGFDTAIAIANTSGDLGTPATSGSCFINFFGSTPFGSTNPAPQVTGIIPAGTVYVNTIQNLAPTFQGYIVANCGFRAAAGLAFVADVGARNIAFTETPEVLTVPRTSINRPLLFSALTNQNGQDSVISIANTTSDPFGTAPVPGTCTLSFFGASAPVPLVTPTIASGAVYVNTISAMAPGFQGYVTASCTFPLARGWAFISDAGARNEGDSLTPEVVTTPRSTTPAPLLFAAVTNQNGDDTNITISNTSQDPFGTAQASGTCIVSYFGDMAGGGIPPSPQTSGTIAPGSQLSFTLSQANAVQGIAATPGFRGYVIADCNFPLARGLATVIPLEISLSIAQGSGQSAPVNSTFAVALQATARDLGGNLIPGVTVTFTAPSSGTSGTFAGGGSTATAVTNTSGVATAPAFTANNITGSYNVTTRAAGFNTSSATFALTNNPASVCGVSVDQPTISVSAAPTIVFFNITAASTCAWTLQSNAPWLNILLNSNGTSTANITLSGNRALALDIRRNTSSLLQQGTLTINGAVVTVNQAGSTDSTNVRYINVSFNNFLAREPGDAGVNFFLPLLNSGQLTRTQMAYNFFGAAEFNAIERFVIGLYYGILGRDPDFYGWDFHRRNLHLGIVTQDTLVTQFLATAEYAAKYGSPTNDGFVTLLFQNALGRNPSVADVAAWSVLLGNGTLTRTQVAQAFLNSPEFQTGAQARQTVFLLHATMLSRDPGTAGYAAWLGYFNSPGSTLLAAVNAFVLSPEFQAKLGPN